MKNLHVRQNSFTTTSRSTSGFSSISSPHAVSWVGRSHTANLQSPGQRSPGILCGQRLAISSSQPRVSQQCNAILAPFFKPAAHATTSSAAIFPDAARADAHKPPKNSGRPPYGDLIFLQSGTFPINVSENGPGESDWLEKGATRTSVRERRLKVKPAVRAVCSVGDFRRSTERRNQTKQTQPW